MIDHSHLIGTGIVYIEIPKNEMVTLTSQLDQIGDHVLKALIRYSVTDILAFRNLRSRAFLDAYSSDRLVLKTASAYDAVLIAREIIIFRHLRPVRIAGATLSYRVGIHYSVDEDQTSDLEIAKDCASFADVSGIVCSEEVLKNAEKENRAEKQILNEFQVFPNRPGYTSWKFRAEFTKNKCFFEHSYFLSYSHEDTAIADHIELLLLRHGKIVRRDENFLEPHARLKEHFAHQIECCDTFLSLYSKNYEKSDICLGELEEAKSYRRNNNDRLRVALITLGERPTFDMLNRLYFEGATRAERENAISKLVNSEHT